jgi:hypothetical protein
MRRMRVACSVVRGAFEAHGARAGARERARRPFDVCRRESARPREIELERVTRVI